MKDCKLAIQSYRKFGQLKSVQMQTHKEIWLSTATLARLQLHIKKKKKKKKENFSDK